MRARKEGRKERGREGWREREEDREGVESKRINAREHSDLVDDVVPVTRSLIFLCEKIIKLMTSIDDPVCHRLNIALPLLEQLWVVQY